MSRKGMSLDEVVAALGITRTRFYQLGLHRLIRRRRGRGRTWYYNAEDVRAMAEAMEQRRQAVASGELPSTFPVREFLARSAPELSSPPQGGGEKKEEPSAADLALVFMVPLLREILAICSDIRSLLQEVRQLHQQTRVTASPPSENRSSPKESQQRFLSVDEVCQLLGVSRRLVAEWIYRGHLPAYRLGPGRRLVRVRLSDLETFLERWRNRPGDADVEPDQG